jgi:hypothetical protein
MSARRGSNPALQETQTHLRTPNEAVTGLEGTWLVLAELFEELTEHGIKVGASDLRDSKALLHLIRTTPLDPCSVTMNEQGTPLTVLEETLERANRELISASLQLGDARSQYWIEKVTNVELEDTQQLMAYGESRFHPGVQRNRKAGWARLTLQQPVGEGRVQDVAEQFGVLIEFEDDLHLVFEGNPSLVKKALADVYFISQP